MNMSLHGADMGERQGISLIRGNQTVGVVKPFREFWIFAAV